MTTSPPQPKPKPAVDYNLAPTITSLQKHLLNFSYVIRERERRIQSATKTGEDPNVKFLNEFLQDIPLKTDQAAALRILFFDILPQPTKTQPEYIRKQLDLLPDDIVPYVYLKYPEESIRLWTDLQNLQFSDFYYICIVRDPYKRRRTRLLNLLRRQSQNQFCSSSADSNEVIAHWLYPSTGHLFPFLDPLLFMYNALAESKTRIAEEKLEIKNSKCADLSPFVQRTDFSIRDLPELIFRIIGYYFTLYDFVFVQIWIPVITIIKKVTLNSRYRCSRQELRDLEKIFHLVNTMEEKFSSFQWSWIHSKEDPFSIILPITEQKRWENLKKKKGMEWGKETDLLDEITFYINLLRFYTTLFFQKFRLGSYRDLLVHFMEYMYFNLRIVLKATIVLCQSDRDPSILKWQEFQCENFQFLKNQKQIREVFSQGFTKNF